MSIIEPEERSNTSELQCEAGMHATPTMGFVHLPSHYT